MLAAGRGRNGQLGRGGARESVAAYRTTPVEVLVRHFGNTGVCHVLLLSVVETSMCEYFFYIHACACANGSACVCVHAYASVPMIRTSVCP